MTTKTLTPPWAKYPDYTRYTIGWRMGSGESYKYDWWDSIKGLAADKDTRLAYLRQHPKAPYSWADHVNSILFPEQKDAHLPLATLIELELVQSDVAYHTWLAQQDELASPWLSYPRDPLTTARYDTRSFWFWSRQLVEVREQGVLDLSTLPEDWEALRPLILTGQLDKLNPSQGLLTLAKMFCTGHVLPPWSLGLQPDKDTSFEEDMNYTSAYNLWVMSAFDDRPHVQHTLAQDPPPESWSAWVHENMLERWSEDGW